MLIRFYDADQGSIRIDGDDIQGIPFEELHKKFGIVFQNDVLFADTIEENIRFGREISQEGIEKAMECAQAQPFIQELEEGLCYRLAIRGSNLSGGQKQRVLIARALAAHPEILILDDSSSALDYQTDARLRQALAKNFKKTTTIIVAQRASSIRHADHILMLENGKEIGYGTHEELMASCEPYRQISIHRWEMKTMKHRSNETKQSKNSFSFFGKLPVSEEDEKYQKEKPRDRRYVLIRLWSYLYQYKWLLFLALFLTIVSNLLGLIGPMLSGYAIDAIHGPNDVDFLLSFLMQP